MGRPIKNMRYHLILSFLFFGMFLPAQAQENWNFTPADDQSLVSRGEKLTFSSDSDWLPEELQKNLLTTLNFVLGPNENLPSADGVNAKDFFHGHIACEIPSSIDKLNFDEMAVKDEVFGTLKLKWWDGVTQEMLPAHDQGVLEMEKRIGSYLRQAIALKYCKLAVVYHTYEYVHPQGTESIDPIDPRRNIVTKQSTLKPEHFSPPDDPTHEKGASSWSELFDDVTQMSFLIDQKGIIHVTTDSTLCKITGRIGPIGRCF